MATAAELLVPLRPGLVPVPATQAGVCRICHGGCDPSYGQCYPCFAAIRILEVGEILPVSMSIEGDLLHRHLRGYKDDRSPQVRARMTLRLAALVVAFVGDHSQCLGDFDSVVSVPSPARTATETIIHRIASFQDQYRPALKVSGLGTKSDLRPDRFSLTRAVRGERVLVLDDTFTSGSTIFSAVAALQDAGAAVVGPLILGRHVNPAWPPSSELLAWLRTRRWSDDRCCRCDGELASPSQML